jgi:hypothetical protein
MRKINKAKAKVSLLIAQLASFSEDPNPESTKSDPILDIFAEASVDKVSKLITNLPNMTSLDYIRTAVLESCFDVITPLIVRLVNLSFAEGWLPDGLK